MLKRSVAGSYLERTLPCQGAAPPVLGRLQQARDWAMRWGRPVRGIQFQQLCSRWTNNEDACRIGMPG